MASDAVKRIIAQLDERLGDSGLGGTVKLDFGSEGSVFIDGTSVPNKVSEGTGQSADCVLAMSFADFQLMESNKMDGTQAFMQGKLRVDGDMGLAVRVGPILRKAQD
ncbi:MAG TPA: SCP2 sterol-binding domain-containing protein [Rhizomicrobium sp.]|nr:SCP2 sterol-binding domain-containing protein [Rhizomicrobium sp.]